MQCPYAHSLRGSSDVPPRAARAYVAHHGIGDAENGGYLSVHQAEREHDTDSANVIIAEFGVPVPRPDWRAFGMEPNPMLITTAPAAAPLHDHVVDVVARGPREKVVRVDARRVIARVANEKPRRDWPVCDNPGKTVSLYAFPANADSAISEAEAATDPRPALVVAAPVNITPELGYRGIVKCYRRVVLSHHVDVTTILPRERFLLSRPISP